MFFILRRIVVAQTTFQKHLGVILDSRLTFDDHLNGIQGKINKKIGLYLQNNLSRPALTVTYKAFTRPHVNYDKNYL